MPVLLSVDSLVNRNHDHREIFTLIWLDTNVDVEENQDMQQKLRSIINLVRKFQDVEDCKKYIQERSMHDQLVLIVSNQLGQQVVPFIHNLQQVSSIYIYCKDKQVNEQWACNFTKVRLL